jgi:hypothetical protein
MRQPPLKEAIAFHYVMLRIIIIIIIPASEQEQLVRATRYLLLTNFFHSSFDYYYITRIILYIPFLPSLAGSFSAWHGILNSNHNHSPCLILPLLVVTAFFSLLHCNNIMSTQSKLHDMRLYGMMRIEDAQKSSQLIKKEEEENSPAQNVE